MVNTATTPDQIRALEHRRLRSLVDADLATASELHANDFQLVNPGGGILTKDEYLSGVASGVINYRVWEPEGEIAVRLFDQVAHIRYRSRLHMSFDGAAGDLYQYWHTDTYELRDGHWQVVWSQATQIQSA